MGESRGNADFSQEALYGNRGCGFGSQDLDGHGSLEQRHPIKFYELDTVERIVAVQPTPARRALLALRCATGAEVGTALRLTRADVWEASQEVRAAGTKTHTRDRVATVSDWAWPIIREYVRTLLPSAPLFPGFRLDVVWRWHRETTEALGLAEHLKVHAAHHHWAVLALRVGRLTGAGSR
jgi:integrase